MSGKRDEKGNQQDTGWGVGAPIYAADFAEVLSNQDLKYQQNLAGRKLAILVLPSTDWPRLKRRGTKTAANAAALKPGDFVEMAAD